jgi:hypothetical protein
MTVAMNGRVLGEIELVSDGGWRTYALNVPATAVKPGINETRFTYRYSGVPREILPPSPDSREIAVAFSRITFRWH